MIPRTSYLIDSSVLIPYMRGNQQIVARLDDLQNKFLSPTVIAELVFGAMRATDPRDGIIRVNSVIAPLPVVQIHRAIAYSFGLVRNQLLTLNQTIPDNDLWIAVTAISYRMRLIARDNHFHRVVPYGLDIEQW